MDMEHAPLRGTSGTPFAGDLDGLAVEVTCSYGLVPPKAQFPGDSLGRQGRSSCLALGVEHIGPKDALEGNHIALALLRRVLCGSTRHRGRIGEGRHGD